MSNYVDGFVLPIPRKHLGEYQQAAQKVAAIWKEYGALDYFEYVGDDSKMEGTLSFADTIGAKENEVVIFGWAVFDSEESRISANKKVASDPRMAEIVGPLVDPSKKIFDAQRMVYGGFKRLV